MESAIRGIPEIIDAVVVSESVDDSCVAFYTGAEVSPRVLRGLLRELVPSYMIPRELIHLSSLPVNSNGKIDRQALLDGKGDRKKRL